MKPGPKPRDVEERFWEKVARSDSCWIWHGKRSPNGYGQYWAGSRADTPSRFVPAHRFAYELMRGPVPRELQMDHLCRVPLCVNPAHLEPVTPRENTMRGTSESARNAAKTHCIRGHAFDAANTYVYANGTRMCRACHRAWTNRKRERVKAGS